MKAKDILKLMNDKGFYPDNISKRGDIFTLKQSYFYTHGDSASIWAHRVKEAVPTAFINSNREDFKVWPKTSNFVVTFTA